MPNWCSNQVTLTNSDTNQIKRVKKAIKEDRLFEEFIPCPKEMIEDGSWYTHNINAWGTKWDVTGGDVVKKSKHSITLVFDTAWSPPLNFYEFLYDNEWGVEAHYYESGMNFVGRWFNGDDEYYEIPASGDEIVEMIPEDIDMLWGLSERAYEEDELEEEDSDSIEGIAEDFDNYLKELDDINSKDKP
jgi:hypothetical protein